MPQKESQGDIDEIRMSPTTVKISSHNSVSGTQCDVSPEVSKKEKQTPESEDSSEQLFLNSVEETSITPLLTMTAGASPSEQFL